MSALNWKNGNDAEELLAMLRRHGVTRYRNGDLEVELGPVALPPRELEDFATAGAESEIEDDARFDHVGIRLRQVQA
jgi:hypothetical protein